MFRNYLLVAWRSLFRNKIYSVINMVGLTIGITTCILIFTYVQTELSYDKHWKDADRIVRITETFDIQGQIDAFACSSFGVAPSLKQNLPEVASAVRIKSNGKLTIRYQDILLDEENNYAVDSNFFDVFNFELLHGNSATALLQPYSVVLSEAMSKRYFKDENPVGKMLQIERKSYTVTGVLKTTLLPSHFQPNSLSSISSLPLNVRQEMESSWFSVGAYTYVKLTNTSSLENFDASLKRWADKIIVPFILENKLNDKVTVRSQRLADIHFDDYYTYDNFVKGQKKYVYIFSCVALFLLIIACFNYMNLATARATKRAREVGLRKVSGAHRGQLVAQFFGESLLLTCIAVVFSISLVELLIPSFNKLIGYTIYLSYTFQTFSFWLNLSSIMLFISLVGGSYPALYLSSFQPAQVLRGRWLEKGKQFGKSQFSLRKVLVVLQFAISIGIIAATIIIYKQLKYMKDKDLGFNKEQVIVLNYPSTDTNIVKNLKAIRNDFLSNGAIANFTTASHLPGTYTSRTLFFVKEKGEAEHKQTALNVISVDYDYPELMKMKLSGGRWFSREFSEDVDNYVINEAAVNYLNLKNPIGSELNNDDIFGKIVGVIKDFNYASPHTKVEPLVMILPSNRYSGSRYILLRVQPNRISEAITFIEQKWKIHFPKAPVAYYFLDDKYNEQYKKENTMLKLFNYFSALTIFISCMGLYGLALFTTEQRVKEIGIRKVLGASVRSIVLLITKDFMLLVLIAIILSAPVTYFLMNRWLYDFDYRISIGVIPFILAGLVSFIIAFITVGYIARQAANTNPVDSTKYE